MTVPFCIKTSKVSGEANANSSEVNWNISGAKGVLSGIVVAGERNSSKK